MYPDWSQDAEPTFGLASQKLICFKDLQDDQASGSEADPQLKDRS